MSATRVVVVTSAEAAAAVGMSPEAFAMWARRRRVEPLRQLRVGRATVNIYDLDAVYAATEDPSLASDTPTGGA